MNSDSKLFENNIISLTDILKPVVNTIDLLSTTNNELTNSEFTNNELTNSELTNNELTIDKLTNNELTNDKSINNELFLFFINEIKSYKEIILNKDNIINSLSLKNDELTMQLNDIETKFNKINNVNLLIKLKENLMNKQTEFKTEINNINNDNLQESKNDNKTISTNYNLDLEFNTIEPKTNIIIEEFDKQSNKSRKRPNMFGRRF